MGFFGHPHPPNESVARIVECIALGWLDEFGIIWLGKKLMWVSVVYQSLSSSSRKPRPKSQPAARTGFHFNYNISECKFCDCDRIWARGKPSQSEEVKPIVPPLFITARFLPCRRCSTPDTRLIKPEQTHFRCSFECPFKWRVWWKI